MITSTNPKSFARSRVARAILFGAPFTALALACSSGAPESSASSASAIITCPVGEIPQCTEGCGPPDCPKPILPRCTCVEAPPPPTVCTATAANDTALSFSSASGTWTLAGTSTAGATAGGTTTSWTIKNGTTTVLTLMSEIAGKATTTQVEYGAPFHGLTQTILTSDGTTNSGSINGRALVAQPVAKPGPIAFQDGQPAPTVTVDAGTQASLYALLDHAHSDAPNVCPGVSGTGALPPAVASLIASFAHAPSAATVQAEVHRAVPEKKPAVVIHAEGTPVGSGEGSMSTVEFESYQNSAIQFITPDCQQCVINCAEEIWDWFTGWAEAACDGECWIPSHGCGEVICHNVPSSCDKGETCCGNGGTDTNGGCCPSGTTCGSYDLGVCCPTSAPVACGDATWQGCFAAGTTCCGMGLGATACGPGDVCVNTTPASPVGAVTWGCCPTGNGFAGGQCCPANQIYDNGLCCSAPTCGGVCCAGGTCESGQCVMPNLGGGGGGGAGVCTPGPYAVVALSDPTVPDSTWVGAWADATGAVKATLGLDPTQGVDFQTIESQVACGSGAYLPAISVSMPGASDNTAYESAWTSTVPSACVSNPPAAPKWVPFTDNTTKSLYASAAGVYLTLYSYLCQGGGPTTPQYAVRYTRVGSANQVYADYMLNSQAGLH